ncbi:MAG TPA: D-alanine--D-alanine ligase [Myxococcota bacterium]|nr:D-alanine--D-alanine ligase [Myxococcota bacterium]
MRIGLTYDLRDDYRAAGYGEEEIAEFDTPETIDAIASALQTLGHSVERVGNLHALVDHLAHGRRWDLVFNTAEGLKGFGRESQVPALLDAYGIPYTMSGPLVCALTLHKAYAKRVLRDAGVPTTPFFLVEKESDVDAVDLPYPLFVKPVAEGTAKGIDASSRIDSRKALRTRCRALLAAYQQPVLVEPFLPGREFTVGVLGTGEASRCVGTLEVALRPEAEAHSYTYLNKENCEQLCDYALADGESARRVEPIALATWRALDGRDAGRVDLRLDALGRPQVLELNPLPGLHPTHSDLPMICTAKGMSYTELIGAIVDSARARVESVPELRERRRVSTGRRASRTRRVSSALPV